MMHPAAVNTVRSVAARLMQPGTVPEPSYDWVAMGV